MHTVTAEVDGAWKKQSCCGVAAWCRVDGEMNQQCHGFTPVYALSSTVVEALAVLQAIRWAKCSGIKRLQILTDSLEVVCALCCMLCSCPMLCYGS